MNSWATRLIFLLVGLGALGYCGWFYVDQHIHQRAEIEAFDVARYREPDSPSQSFPAKLSISRLDLTAMVEEGVGTDTLRHAAGHIPRTALPGEPGNVVVAAHRDTLFRKLRNIRKHDRIVLSTMRHDYDYEVISTAIVLPTDVSVLAPLRGQKTLTLVTCYPFYYVGAAPKRFIVRARQIPAVANN